MSEIPGRLSLTFSLRLACFVALHLTILVLVAGLKMQFKLHAYTRKNWWSYLTSSLQQSALSFTLFWTLFYGLVYLY